MPVTVVVGGQYGSEGKGKVAHYLAREMDASVAIRCGGPNSGHTVIDPNGKPLIFQQLPTASILPDIISVLCAGSYIDLDILQSEIAVSRVDPTRLYIDPNAVIITQELKEKEKNRGLTDSIASTGSGTGEAVLSRIRRDRNIVFAKDIEELDPYIQDTKGFLRSQLDQNQRVILEGTQGYGLSLLHSEYYPYVTSRDTSAAGFVAEAGLSPLDVDDVVLTIRAFPIRVAGNSGPLLNEITWQTITEESGSKVRFCEHTSVTKRLRRIARFDPQIVKESIRVNHPTRIVLNHLDYVDANCTFADGYTRRIRKFLNESEYVIGQRVDYLGFSPQALIRNDSGLMRLVYQS
ncbi:MAG: adenylosuccinate synthetase [Deltaproteobacteria bacterium]|nr:adenylosuccinate synthetase [Deltaproteobacteria bacterium]